MSTTRLIPTIMLETVLGPLWVWLILSERPTSATLTGGALIFAALTINTALDLLKPRQRTSAHTKHIDATAAS